MGSGRELDGLARDLATGRISRRIALGRLAGAAAGVAIASIPGAEALAASRSKKCPKSRRCGQKCCPKHAKCKHGKCKCVAGYTKCGKKCFDLQTDPDHCGDCDIVCADGEGCFSGQCVMQNNCGNGVIDSGETCDGNDLGGETCQSLGFTGGTLACNPNCMAFDTSGCTGTGCTPGNQMSCGSNVGECQAGTTTCLENGTWGPCQNEVGPQAELCNGKDDDCDGVVDNGYDVGTSCTGPGACSGVKVCNVNQTGTVCVCT